MSGEEHELARLKQTREDTLVKEEDSEEEKRMRERWREGWMGSGAASSQSVSESEVCVEPCQSI